MCDKGSNFEYSHVGWENSSSSLNPEWAWPRSGPAGSRSGHSATRCFLEAETDTGFLSNIRPNVSFKVVTKWVLGSSFQYHHWATCFLNPSSDMASRYSLWGTKVCKNINNIRLMGLTQLQACYLLSPISKDFTVKKNLGSSYHQTTSFYTWAAI